MKETDIAYLAGFIDGEGCIYIERRSGKGGNFFRLNLVITSTYLPVLEGLKGIWGGNLHSRSAKGNRKQSWGLEWNGEAAMNILIWTYPYLVIKREEAQVAVFYQTGRVDGRRGRGKGFSGEELEEYAWFQKRLQELKKYAFIKTTPGLLDQHQAGRALSQG